MKYSEKRLYQLYSLEEKLHEIRIHLNEDLYYKDQVNIKDIKLMLKLEKIKRVLLKIEKVGIL